MLSSYLCGNTLKIAGKVLTVIDLNYVISFVRVSQPFLDHGATYH